jgi:hypothetical protein
MEVKELISKWRARTADLKQLNLKLDRVREEFNALDAAKSTDEAELEAQRMALAETLEERIAELNKLRAKKAEVLEENKKHLEKVTERIEKNRQHKAILDERNAILLEQTTKLDTAEAGTRNRLATFRSERQRLLEQIQSRSAQARASLPKEKEDFEKQLFELREKLSEVKVKRSEEERAWEAELLRRRKAARAASKKVLIAEAQICQQERVAWANLARTAPDESFGRAFEAKVQALKSRLRVTAQ